MSERRSRRTRGDVRQLLLESALEEFGAKGFDGASTRAIAQRVDAHQPQINYHFESKEALWTAAVDHLFALLSAEVGQPPVLDPMPSTADLGVLFAESIRRFVRFAAARPELNRIMVHEATADTDRLRWMVDRHIRPFYDWMTAVWTELLAAGVAAPIDPKVVHYVLVGSASLPFVNAPETRLLTGTDPTEPAFVERHADGIVAMMLPGLDRDQ